MRRREEKLRCRPDGKSRSHRVGIAPGLRDRLARQAYAWEKIAPIRSEALGIDANSRGIDPSIGHCINVRDGFALIGNAINPLRDRLRGIVESGDAARGIDMLGEARIRGLDFSKQDRVRVLALNPLFVFSSRSAALKIKPASVHSVDVSLRRADQVKDGARFLLQKADIPLSRYKISKLLHSRESVSLESLKESERSNLVREAGALKGIPAERTELLAVFRHVPIEVITSLRFIAEKKIILFGISPGVRLTTTRVHDMAAVRDSAGQEIYLIPHRTKFRTVRLD